MPNKPKQLCSLFSRVGEFGGCHGYYYNWTVTAWETDSHACQHYSQRQLAPKENPWTE